ncbi:hypothetical protein L6Q96_06840 [Candidatus Binatia bacterium]|nr:hypothetical protein [Candidatus Binatia bacterium]
MLRWALLAAILLVAVVAAVSLLAAEAKEVVLLATVADDGSKRTTRIWIADTPQGTLIEAAHPDRPFLAHLRARPQVELTRGDRVVQCTAAELPNPQGHEAVRRAFREKYGWADRWIGYLDDLSHSIAIRLQCR